MYKLLGKDLRVTGKLQYNCKKIHRPENTLSFYLKPFFLKPLKFFCHPAESSNIP